MDLSASPCHSHALRPVALEGGGDGLVLLEHKPRPPGGWKDFSGNVLDPQDLNGSPGQITDEVQ